MHRALLREIGATDEPLPEDSTSRGRALLGEGARGGRGRVPRGRHLPAWLLEDVLFERGWEEPFAGEITGMIGSGLFIRFGDVFEGYLPARRLPGDYYEIDALETRLVGRRGGRIFRLGDPIDVRVQEIRKNEGKVELSLAG